MEITLRSRRGNNIFSTMLKCYIARQRCSRNNTKTTLCLLIIVETRIRFEKKGHASIPSIRALEIERTLLTFQSWITDESYLFFVRHRPLAQRPESVTYLRFHKPASNQGHLLSLQFKPKVKRFPSPRAFCWLQINFHEKCPTMALSLYLCKKNKIIVIIMRLCLHSSGKGFTYRRGCSCKVGKKQKNRQVRWLQNAILTTYLKLENDGLCGVQAERRGWIFQKRLKTKDVSSGLPLRCTQWIWDEAASETDLYHHNKTFCMTSKP